MSVSPNASSFLESSYAHRPAPDTRTPTDARLDAIVTSYRGLNVNDSPPSQYGGSQYTPNREPGAPTEVPGASELIAGGFEPLELHTGITSIIDEWPSEYKRGIPETRLDQVEGDESERVWFVKSPWPSLTLAQAISMVWENLAWDNESNWSELRRVIFAWSDEQAVAAARAVDLT